jgi:hypothetical protein
MATANLKSQKKTQPYILNISRPHAEASSKFSLFSGLWNVRCTSVVFPNARDGPLEREVYVSVVFPNARDVELAGRDL